MNSKKQIVLVRIIAIFLVIVVGATTLKDNSNLKAELEEAKKIEEELPENKNRLEEEVKIVSTNMYEVIDKLNEVKEDKEKLENDKKKLNSILKEKEDIIQNLKKQTSKSQSTAPSRGSTLSKTLPPGEGKVLTVQATAYCPCTKCCGKWSGGPTASGVMPKAGRTIAVDPKVIPLGSTVEVEGYETFIAEDTGSAVKGNIIDIYFNTHSEALKFGRKKGLTVRVK